jgi:uncharacterized protein YfkK (UPF0435 family)
LQNWKLKKTEPTDLEIEIARLLEVLKNMDPATDENYAKVSDHYVTLTKLHNETNSKKRVSPDAMAAAATNLAGILLILNYEHAHVMTSKALGFVVKSIK